MNSTPHVDAESRPAVHVLLKFTYPKGSGAIELSSAAARALGSQLQDAAQCGPGQEIELRGPGRFVGSDQLDEVQALTALHQTLGLIERAGFCVRLRPGRGGPVIFKGYKLVVEKA